MIKQNERPSECVVTARKERLGEVLITLEDVGVTKPQVERGVWTTYEGLDLNRFVIKFRRPAFQQPWREKKFVNTFRLLLLESIREGSHP